MTHARTRDGMTLLEVSVALTIAGAALASGAAVLGFLTDQQARAGTQPVVSASAVRHTIRSWTSQARLATDDRSRLEVVRRMYVKRFREPLGPGLTVPQLQAREGLRVRQTYARLSQEHRIEWKGRNYDRGRWDNTDPVNQAISVCNSCLYGLCHAAIVTAGYSPALGFIHTGKQLSFVYDIADLYKADITLPIAFQGAAEMPDPFERTLRLRCRDRFRETKLLKRVIPDIHEVLGEVVDEEEGFGPDSDPAMPTDLWVPDEEPRDGASNLPDIKEDPPESEADEWSS